MKKTIQRRKIRTERRPIVVVDKGGKRAKWFLLFLFGVSSYFIGARVSPAISDFWATVSNGGADTSGVVHTAEFSEDDDSVPVAGSLPEYTEAGAEEKPKAVKSATGSVFSEGEPPLIVGGVPDGWRVETSNEIKAKFGPHKVPVGDDITFVVPVYTLVPSEAMDGVYIIEPGRTKTGDDEGGTLSAILSRLDGEISTINTALGSLSKALAMLPAQAPSENEKPEISDGEGISYKASVSGR